MERPQRYARLSKDQQRALCAITDCGGVVGWILPVVGYKTGGRELVLPPGWAPVEHDKSWRPNRLYRLTNYARLRIRDGKRTQIRGNLGGYAPDERVFCPLLPCLVECPRCQRRQALDPGQLGTYIQPLSYNGLRQPDGTLCIQAYSVRALIENEQLLMGVDPRKGNKW